MSCCTTFRPSAASDARGFLPVAVRTMQAHREHAFNLYLRASKDRAAVLYCGKSVPLPPASLDQLVEQGVHTLYVPLDEAPAYREHVRTHILPDASIPVSERYCLLRDATRPVFGPALAAKDVDRLVVLSDECGQDLATVLGDFDDMGSDVFGAMAHERSMFTHLLNVGTIGVLLASRCGIRAESERKAIAQGALLHDLGKLFLPKATFCGGMRPAQAQQCSVRRHPTLGFENLCLRPELGWGQLMMVYQHHERCDGSGYPCRLVGNDIHPWARLCAVADVYAALMRDQARRKDDFHAEIVEHFDRESGRGLDKEISQCLMAMLPQS